MARTDPQLKLRLTEALKQQVTESARLSGRSVNAEIVYRLEQSYSPDVRAQVEGEMHEAYEDVLKEIIREAASIARERSQKTSDDQQ